MLRRPDGTDFTSGRARYLDQAAGSHEPTAKIFVKITAASLGGVIPAQLDTGAAWSMLDADVAEALSLLDGQGEPKRISTRLGDVSGRLERTWLEIVADDGDSLNIEATVFVSPRWHGGTFLGYGGLLERVRFAVDPGEGAFHFGLL